MTTSITRSVHSTLRHVADHVAKRQSFHGSHIVGREVEWTPETGQLDHGHVLHLRHAIETARNNGGPTYVVSSYGTPIAWTNPDGTLVVPDERYSTTTSKHQYHVRQAVR